MSLSPITHPLLDGLPHGFFTRQGGVSDGLYATLNAGPGSGDSAAAVSENRARIAAHLGVAGHALRTLHQIHSATAILAGPTPPTERPKADALVCTRPGLAVGALAADCAPVLLADVQAGVVAAAHAGWRGALDGVLGETVALMAAQGARPGRIGAVIGPCIGPLAYEVGPEFADRFVATDGAFARFFADGPAGRPHFDLPGFCLDRLAAAGVGGAAWTGHCTYADATRFFSYRRATHRGEGDYGRLIAAIRLP